MKVQMNVFTTRELVNTKFTTSNERAISHGQIYTVANSLYGAIVVILFHDFSTLW